MLNIIKMNFYRVVRTKSTWSILIIIVAFSLLVNFMNLWERNDAKNQEVKNNQASQSEQQEEEIIIGIQINALEGSQEGQPEPYLLEQVCIDLSSGIVCLFIGIFAVLFFYGEEKHGFIKNLIGKTKNRWSLYVAKNVVVFAFSGFCILLFSLSIIISGLFFFPNSSFGFPILGKTLIYLLVIWLLHGVFGCATGFVFTLIRNSTISITISILTAAGIIANLTHYINEFLPWLKIDLMQYQVVPHIQSISYNSAVNTLVLAVTVAFVYLILYNLLGSILTEKRDVV